MTKITAVLFAMLASALFFTSCVTQISGSLQADGHADMNVFSALEPRMSMLVMGLSAAAGMAPGTPVLDGPAMAATMANAPGIASVSLANTSQVSIEGRVQSSHVGEMLAAPGAEFITFDQGAAGGGRFSARLDRDSAPGMLALISPDITNYLAALMAPMVTGERMTRQEYLLLVGSVYGAGIAEEIAGARIRAFVDFPGPIQSVRGGTFNGRRAEFSIPLVDILVLDVPLYYEVIWR